MERHDVTTLSPEDEGIGPLIQRLRLERGWSQETLAERVGMSRAYLSQIEASTSKWPAKYIAGLSRELGIPPSILGRAAGRIIKDEDYPDTPVLGPMKGQVTVGGSVNLVTGDEADPYFRAVVDEARGLSPAGRRALASQARALRELEASYHAGNERDPTLVKLDEVWAELEERDRLQLLDQAIRRRKELSDEATANAPVPPVPEPAAPEST